MKKTVIGIILIILCLVVCIVINVGKKIECSKCGDSVRVSLFYNGNEENYMCDDCFEKFQNQMNNLFGR